jgi:hypothetical protein
MQQTFEDTLTRYREITRGTRYFCQSTSASAKISPHLSLPRPSQNCARTSAKET